MLFVLRPTSNSGHPPHASSRSTRCFDTMLAARRPFKANISTTGNQSDLPDMANGLSHDGKLKRDARVVPMIGETALGSWWQLKLLIPRLHKLSIMANDSLVSTIQCAIQDASKLLVVPGRLQSFARERNGWLRVEDGSKQEHGPSGTPGVLGGSREP